MNRPAGADPAGRRSPSFEIVQAWIILDRKRLDLPSVPIGQELITGFPPEGHDAQNWLVAFLLDADGIADQQGLHLSCGHKNTRTISCPAMAPNSMEIKVQMYHK